jgi:hypothetical protein
MLIALGKKVGNRYGANLLQSFIQFSSPIIAIRQRKKALLRLCSRNRSVKTFNRFANDSRSRCRQTIDRRLQQVSYGAFADVAISCFNIGISNDMITMLLNGKYWGLKS